MSKAFTRESDDAPEPGPLPRLVSSLPPGAKNYLTPDGARRLETELACLIQERSQIIASARESDARLRLPAMDQRILQLQHGLQTAVITPAPPPPWDQVRFGATVAVRHDNGEASVYRIVGLDETDVDRGWVSWLSPIAKALLNARLGGKVRFKFPSGEEPLEIVTIAFDP